MWRMSILHRLRSDLQRSVVEHQALLLAQVLRQRFTELTLGDLREVLTSPLGRGLENFKLVDLSRDEASDDGHSAGATTPVPVPAKRGPGRPRKTGVAPANLARPAGTPSANNSEYVASIVDVLRTASAAMTSGELRSRLGGSPSTMYRAVTELIKNGQVRSEGKPARYSWIHGERGADIDSEAGAADEGAAGRARPAAPSARTLAGRAQFDAAVINVLREANGWVGASSLRAQVGGSDNQVRIALHRLVAAGQVTRRGERNSTEYRLL